MKTRTYMDVRFDVTDLSKDERSALALEVSVQAEASDFVGDDGHGWVGHRGVDAPELEWNEVEVEDEPPFYSWHGWESGEDIDPPEPGKRWLTITEDDEEIAVIVHRMSPRLNNAKLMTDKIVIADHIVKALNTATVTHALNEDGEPSQDTPTTGAIQRTPETGYVLTVCLNGIPEGRDYITAGDKDDETIDAAGEAICRYEEEPEKIVTLLLSRKDQDYRAGQDPQTILTAEGAAAILFGYQFDEPGFDPVSAQFISGADVCAALYTHFNLSDGDLLAIAKARRERKQ